MYKKVTIFSDFFRRQKCMEISQNIRLLYYQKMYLLQKNLKTKNILYKTSRVEIELHLVILYSAHLIWGRA